MPHNSERHRAAKRERTHRLNAKYGRHGHGGEARVGHRGHAGRQFPCMRAHLRAEDFPDDGHGPVYQTAWETDDDGNRVKVTRFNVQKVRDYQYRRQMRGVLDEIDRNEAAQEAAVAQAQGAKPHDGTAQPRDAGTQQRHDAGDINAKGPTSEEYGMDAMLIANEADSTIGEMHQRIAQLNEEIAKRDLASARQRKRDARPMPGRSAKGGMPKAKGRRANGGRRGGYYAGGAPRAACPGNARKDGAGISIARMRKARRDAIARRTAERMRKRVALARRMGNAPLAERLERQLALMQRRNAGTRGKRGR